MKNKMKKINLLYILIFSLLVLTSCSQTNTRNMNHEMMNGNMMNSELYLPSNTNQVSSETQTIKLNDGDTYQISADLVEHEIDGKKYEMFAYNGMIPGPLLKVKKGSSIKVNFKNNLDQETTIHWHGLRHDVKDDGVPSVSQESVKPGESFTYTLSFPDSGMFWYHPHVREDLQQDLGLYGNILVYDEKEIKEFNKEEYLTMDDILINNNELIPYGSKNANFALMGRYGNVMLINGKTNYELKVNKGDVVRFYLTSVSNVRPFNVNFDGAKIKLIGSDIGKYENEEFIDSIIISPAERYIVDIYFENERVYEIKNVNPSKTYTLGKINVLGTKTKSDFSSSFNQLKSNYEIISDIKNYEKYFDKKIDYNLDLTLDMQGMMNMGGMMDNSNSMMKGMPCHKMSDGTKMGNCDDEDKDYGNIEWEDDMGTMNSMTNSDMLKWIIKDKNTKKENMDIKMNAKVGDVIKIRLFNDPKSMHPMQHPIHLHGQRFLVLEKDGVKNENLVWKDTVLVPKGSTVYILVDVTNSGEWMMHCHISEHLTSGMMTSLMVEA